jgi:hypothetical protein
MSPAAAVALDFARLAPPAGTRIAIVGGCGGIGRSLVAACGHLLLDIVVLDLPQALAKYPPPARARALPTDAGDETSVEASFRSIASTWGSLDVLVCLSGIAIIPPQRAEDLTAAQWDRVMQINLRSAWLCARRAIPLMRNGGAIVNISSSLAFNPNKGFSAYVASKGGLVSLTKAIAMERACDPRQRRRTQRGRHRVPRRRDGGWRRAAGRRQLVQAERRSLCRQHPARTPGHCRRHRRPDPVPGRPRLPLHHGPGHPCQRRAHHAVMAERTRALASAPAHV